MSDKIDFQEALKGLSTTLRKARADELYVALTSDLGLTVQIGETDSEVRVLHLTSVKTFLERLDAEIRIPSIGDRVIGREVWYTAAIQHSVLRICKKKRVRKLLPGEPAMPGDRLLGAGGVDIGKALNTYKNSIPGFQDATQSKYVRVPWTKEEYRQRQAEWVKFHDLKPGDTVKVCCAALDSQDGWGNTWDVAMNTVVGKTVEVREIDHNIRLRITDGLSLGFPFYVLQVVKKPVVAGKSASEIVLDDPKAPTIKYRKFRTPQEVLSWVMAHGQIVVRKNGDWKSVVGASKTSNMEFQPDTVNVQDYMNIWTSANDGTPFGVAEMQ